MLIYAEMHLPASHSLKEKRQVLRALKDRLSSMGAAAAEVAFQDLWQRSAVTIALVDGTASKLSQRREKVLELLYGAEVQVLSLRVQDVEVDL